MDLGTIYHRKRHKTRCPLSDLICITAVEILVEIKLNGSNHSIKISQLADDTTLFLKSKNEISIALSIMERFGNLSGLRLNRKKTEGMWLGRLRHCKEQFENIT